MRTFRLLAIVWVMAVCSGTIVSCKSSDKEPPEEITHPFVGKWERISSEGWTTLESSWTDLSGNTYTEKSIYEFNRDQKAEDGQYFIQFSNNTEGKYINNRVNTLGATLYFPGDRTFPFTWVHAEKENVLEIIGGGKIERIKINQKDSDTLIFYYTSYNSAPEVLREEITSVFKRVK